MLQYLFCSEIYEFAFRCIDIQQSNEVERTQALRLVRKVRHLTLPSILFLMVCVLNVIFLCGQSLIFPVQMITVNAQLFPRSVTNALIAVGNDGLQERDRMVRACIATICELGKSAVIFPLDLYSLSVFKKVFNQLTNIFPLKYFTFVAGSEIKA